jgi:hypothetical protein
MKRCSVCGTSKDLHCHEVFFGTGNRKISIKYKFQEWLCGKDHNLSNNGVHFNHELDLKLKRKHQLIYELELMSDGISQEEARETFRRIIGKSYL